MASDWTTGAAKWAAVFLLGGASALGVAWSLWGGPAPRVEIRAAQPEPRRPTAPADAPQRPEPRETGETVRIEPAVPRGPAAEDEMPAAPPDRAAPRAAQQLPTPSLTRTININTASAAELELLPGIGPAMAARILEHRASIGRFRSVEQLDDVKGIGPKTLEKLRPLVRVD